MKAYLIHAIRLGLCVLFVFRINPASAQWIPTLVFPSEGAELENGCDDKSVEKRWVFDWDDCPGAEAYHLYVIGPHALYPLIDEYLINTSNYTFKSYGYIIPRNSYGWKWKVRAMIEGIWGSWSEERFFNVEPLNTHCNDEMRCIVYPNPFRDFLFIELVNEPAIENLKIHVYSSIGSIMRIEKQALRNQDKLKIDFKNFPAGTYLILIDDKRSIFKSKLVKF